MLCVLYLHLGLVLTPELFLTVSPTCSFFHDPCPAETPNVIFVKSVLPKKYHDVNTNVTINMHSFSSKHLLFPRFYLF